MWSRHIIGHLSSDSQKESSSSQLSRCLKSSAWGKIWKWVNMLVSSIKILTRSEILPANLLLASCKWYRWYLDTRGHPPPLKIRFTKTNLPYPLVYPVWLWDTPIISLNLHMFTMAPQFDGVSVTVDDFPDANMKKSNLSAEVWRICAPR